MENTLSVQTDCQQGFFLGSTLTQVNSVDVISIQQGTVK